VADQFVLFEAVRNLVARVFVHVGRLGGTDRHIRENGAAITEWMSVCSYFSAVGPCQPPPDLSRYNPDDSRTSVLNPRCVAVRPDDHPGRGGKRARRLESVDGIRGELLAVLADGIPPRDRLVCDRVVGVGV
jgi:hypothetical protein